MNRRQLAVVATVCVTACSPKASPVPTPSSLSADSSRATLIAALMDMPLDTLQAVTPWIPRGRGKAATVIVAFAVDSAGKALGETITVLRADGDPAYVVETCRTVPKSVFTSPPNGGPALMMVPFFTARTDAPMPDAMAMLDDVKAHLASMSTLERRDYLLDKGCRRFR